MAFNSGSDFLQHVKQRTPENFLTTYSTRDKALQFSQLMIHYQKDLPNNLDSAISIYNFFNKNCKLKPRRLDKIRIRKVSNTFYFKDYFSH